MRYLKFLFVGIFLFATAGCASWWNDTSKLNNPESIYARGQEKYQQGDYDEAIELFQRVTEEYPLDTYAILAELGVADSYFSDEDYATAESNYSDFLEFHPTNENLPYVMYQLGMCHYKQIGKVDRDQTETRMAEQAFQKLLSRFPSGKFSLLGQEKLKECRSMLGEHEFDIGKFYFNIGQYKAALARFENIQKNYAQLGMDYKTQYFIKETKKHLEGEVSKE